MTKRTDLIDVDAIDPSVRELVPRYMKRREADVATIADLLKRREFNEIRILAHNMHGSGAAYGIKQISEIGRTMEIAARDADQDGVAEGVDALRRLVDQFRAE